MNAIGIIPARYSSSRFPGKPLAMIGAKSMLQRVYERARLSKLNEVIIATDDNRISQHAKALGAQVIMTSKKHVNGTERVAEAYKKLGKPFDIIINIQGDEPFIEPRQINQLIMSFKDKNVQISTLAETFTNSETLQSPNSIKIVVNKLGYALYFSRSVVPFVRGSEYPEWMEKFKFLRHIGIYAFRSENLNKIVKLQPVSIESAESLEQLRWLYNGYTIKVNETTYHGVSVDTPEDLERANFILKNIYE